MGNQSDTKAEQKAIQLANNLANLLEKHDPKNGLIKLIDEAVLMQDFNQLARLFGGMGSLNDLWVKNTQTREEFERLTTELFDAIKGIKLDE